MTDKPEVVSKKYSGVSIRAIGAITTIIAIVLAFFAFGAAGYVTDAKDSAEADEQLYIECSDAVNDLEDASDYLTTQVRMYVTTGRKANMNAYIEELTVTNRREKAVDVLHTNIADNEEAAARLNQALKASDDLTKKELAAMKLAADYYKHDDLPEMVVSTDLSSVPEGMSREQKLEKARNLVLGEEYDNSKAIIKTSVAASSEALLSHLNSEMEANNETMQNLLFALRIAVALLLCVVLVLVLVVLMYVLKPLDRYIKRIKKSEPLEANGSYELHYLADAYNTMYEDNNKRIMQLREFAERDPLTGLSNKNGYDSFLATHTRDIALLLIDVDNFKDFNKVYGRDTGDAVLRKLANALSTAFRSTDFPCRVESDKFAVIMTNMNSGLHDAVTNKIEMVNTMLADDADDLPLITLSVGAAFSTESMDDAAIYHAANEALKHVQQNGMNGLAFYGEDV